MSLSLVQLSGRVGSGRGGGGGGGGGCNKKNELAFDEELLLKEK